MKLVEMRSLKGKRIILLDERWKEKEVEECWGGFIMRQYLQND